MRRFFNPESPFMLFMARIADYFMVNIFMVLCSFPIVTLGAAFTAAHKVMQDIQFDNEQPIVRSFFRSFAQNFKQSTIVWLLTLLAAASLAGDALLIYLYAGETFALPLYVLVGSVSVVVLGSASYAFSLIARYDNTLKQHLRNSLLLSIGHLPKTVVMVALYAVPVLLCLAPETSNAKLDMLTTITLVFCFFGFSLLIYLQARLMKPVLVMLETKAEHAQLIEDASADDVPHEIAQ